MNAVEIEQAVSQLAEQPFDAAEFPFEFLRAFGNKDVTIKRLRKGDNNASDVSGGVLQRNNIHMATCAEGKVGETLTALRESPRTAANRVRFILATDGIEFHAEDLTTDDPPAICEYATFPDRFGFFLPLAGITTVKQIRESAFDIRATGRLNRLYRQLLADNPDWDRAERRPDMNHFMARMIFCFFAEDTGIFNGEGLFTRTVDQMSERDASNTHEVIEAIFRAMNTPVSHNGNPDDRYRKAAGTQRWADAFPYVNGGLFSGDLSVPRFSRIARSYFLTIGRLEWTQINPDIFGSMIQAIADDEERGELGMHYTSVPNILKVLNPLFLDDLRAQLEAAGDNARSLLNLRKRMSRIRVFDPACGSGNFLVISYKEMRAIEAEINQRRGEADRRSDIPLTNFRGIELRDFAAEIARLALIIAEYQSDVLYRGQNEALAEFLPLNAENWIVGGNALHFDWLSLCPPTGTAANLHGDDLFSTPLDQPLIDFESADGETYICGNPPYLGSVLQNDDQKADMANVFGRYTAGWKSLDYVSAWVFLAAKYLAKSNSAAAAFVTTNSICQGEQVPILWPLILGAGISIDFAYSSFKWANLASQNAGVTVIIIGLKSNQKSKRKLFQVDQDGIEHARLVDNINPYLSPGRNVIVHPISSTLDSRAKMIRGNMPNDGGHLVLNSNEMESLVSEDKRARAFIRRFVGSKEFINSTNKYCIWIEDDELSEALSCPPIRERIEKVREARLSGGKQARDNAGTPHRFVFAPHREGAAIVVPRVSSENREFLPVGITDGHAVISERNFALYDAPLWNMALIASRLHWVWISAVCVRMRTDFSYSNTLGWNTFPTPRLTEQNKADLARCAEEILIAREAHWPASIADLYSAGTMPDNLRRAHDRNDETLERIYVGRRFRNDTERLEVLFDLYAKVVASPVLS